MAMKATEKDSSVLELSQSNRIDGRSSKGNEILVRSTVVGEDE